MSTNINVNNHEYEWNILLRFDFPKPVSCVSSCPCGSCCSCPLRLIPIVLKFTPSSEFDFISRIFARLPAKYLLSLVEIRAHQLYVLKNEHYFEWMKKRNGTWYFNTDVNKDEDTLFWNRKRIEFINQHF